jgi:hypothetical protein
MFSCGGDNKMYSTGSGPETAVSREREGSVPVDVGFLGIWSVGMERW